MTPTLADKTIVERKGDDDTDRQYVSVIDFDDGDAALAEEDGYFDEGDFQPLFPNER